MIVVTDIQFTEVPDDAGPEYIYTHLEIDDAPELPVAERYRLVRETIHGRKFRRPSDNKIVMIGNSKHVAEVLGMQVDRWDALIRDNLRLSRDLSDASDRCFGYVNALYDEQQRIKKTRDAAFLTRLKWLFTGVKI